MNIGAFVSTSGGLLKTLDRADALGIESVMLFASSPQSWKRRVFPEEELSVFRERYTAGGYQSLWTHGGYLMNFATANPEALQKSIGCLVAELIDADRLGANGVFFHIGSHKGRGLDEVIEEVAQAMKTVVTSAPDNVQIVLENSAGMGGSIGSSFAELGQILKLVGSERLRICLDTQHAFAAGYPVHTQAGLEQVLAEFDREIGLDKLVALHANDSKVPFGGGKDRHENIGEGFIGDDGWRVMTHNPVLQKFPFLLEVPGADGHGPDKPNVDRLRLLASE